MVAEAWTGRDQVLHRRPWRETILCDSSDQARPLLSASTVHCLVTFLYVPEVLGGHMSPVGLAGSPTQMLKIDSSNLKI